MQPTTLQTVNIGVIGTNNPTVIARGFGVPTRVLLYNVGPILLYISTNIGDLNASTGPGGNVFQLPTTIEKVFMLAPGQALYSVGAGIGGLLSVAASEAFPAG